MKKTMFFGRDAILGQLASLFEKQTASFVTCRGRRRIGKSTLVKEFARRSQARFIKLEGLRPEPGMTNADQLRFFATKLASQVGGEKTVPDDWYSAFVRLDAAISNRQRTVVLLDEISWMAFDDKTFAAVLKNAWDDLFKAHPRLVLVVCGSVSSWIRDNIVDNKAFVGRRSLDVVVPELPLSDCVKFWGARAQRIDPREIIDVLSVTGGVPRYLEEVNPRLSAAENIRRLCYMPNSVLRVDFDDMFNDVITRKQKYVARVLRTFVDGPKSVSEVAFAMGVEKCGDITDAVQVLLEAGFVAEECAVNPETGTDLRERRFRLKDNYSRFYLKYIERNKRVIDADAFSFASLEELEGIDSVMGLAFENLVVNNYRELIRYLHMDRALVTSAGPYRRSGTKGRRGVSGCQIDLLIQTRRALCFVEVKRKREIGREVIDEVDRKVRSIKRPDGVSARTALVYDGHLSPVAAADGYFDAIIHFPVLLGLKK
jgi:AAA+ ATPase superfamily predicted ATPase